MTDQAPELLPLEKAFAENPYPAYSYAAGNVAGERHRAMKYARMIVRALTRPPSERPVAPVREHELELAAWLIALEDAEAHKPVWDSLIEHARQYVKAGITEKHWGDCTNDSHSCVVCGTDSALLHAKQILAALTAERPEAAVAWQRRYKAGLVSSWETIPDDRSHMRHDMERQGWEIRPLYAIQHEEPGRETK